MSSYDEVPYSCYPYPQTHPDRLATIATLFGMQPAPVDRCRVLELGCGTGGNLLPMAAALPNSQFLGLDLSGRQIAEGKRTIEELGLKNVEMRHQDIAEFPADSGAFDFIISHGVYSWVPDAVQESMLEICGTHLAPQGVAYISYNTYPGWHLRGTVRDIMYYHARKFRTPRDRVGHARGLLDFLVRSIPTEDNAYGLLLKAELELLKNKEDFYLLHEHLEANNRPMYFHEFAERAQKAHLRYLGEADVNTMSVTEFSPEIAGVLRQLAADEIELEQYMDFVRNRKFRQTLLCRESVFPDRQGAPDRVAKLSVSSSIRVDKTVENKPGEVTFRAPHGSMTTSNKAFKAAFQILEERWPGSVPFPELVEGVARMHPELAQEGPVNSLTKTLRSSMFEAFTKQFVELHSCPPRLMGVPGASPRSTALARHQAEVGPVVTNGWHRPVRLDSFSRLVLQHLDGSHDEERLIERLQGFIASGRISVSTDGRPVAEGPELDRALRGSLKDCLTRLASEALLIAG